MAELKVNVGDASNVPAENLTIETNSNGGQGRIAWEEERRLPYPQVLNYVRAAKVTVSDAQGDFTHGRMYVRRRDSQAGKAHFYYTAQGYAATARDLNVGPFNTTYANQTIEAIFNTHVRSYCPQLDATKSAAHVRITGKVIVSLEVRAAQYSLDVFETLCKFGDETGGPLYWHVWTEADGVPYLEVVGRPTAPTYETSEAWGAQVDVSDDLTTFYNSVISYANSNPGGIQQVDDLASQQYGPPIGLGYVRREAVNFSGGPVAENQTLVIHNGADNLLMAQAQLLRRDTQHPLSGTITIPEGARVVDVASGANVLVHRMRAGQIIRVRDLAPEAGVEGNNAYDFYISGTRYTARDGQQVLALEGHQTLDAMQARVFRQARLI